MGEKFDNKTKDALLGALESAKAYRQKFQDRREQQLWKTISIPCSLSSVIHGLTKNELDGIRKNLDLKNLSSLKKTELASELVQLIPTQFEKIIYSLDQKRYGLVKTIVKSSGYISEFDITIEEIESLMRYGIVFPGIHNEQRILMMPIEVMDVFTRIDGLKLQNIALRNSEWIQLTHGMLYYYGVMSLWFASEKVMQLTGTEVDFVEFMNVISFASDYYGRIHYTPYGLREHRVLDAKTIIDEHQMRTNIDFYPFTKEQLIKASNPGHIDRTPTMNDLIDFLMKHYKLSEDEINEIALQLVNIINIDSKPMTLLEYLQSWIEFPSFDFVQQLTTKVMELYNHTRQWALKGYTPNELFQKEKPFFKPLPSEPFGLRTIGSKVIDINTRKKVGRNEPCPCGSGKKYKKCCWSSDNR